MIVIVIPYRKNRFAEPNEELDRTAEERIAFRLWQWLFSKTDLEKEQIETDSHLKNLLMFWFPWTHIPFTRKRGMWCDGIIYLELYESTGLGVVIAGVGYFPHIVLPFEFEFDFTGVNQAELNRIFLRIGKLDRFDRLVEFTSSANPQRVLKQRPTATCDWAAAVELTPGYHR